jgi:hypothetical protein
MNLQKLIMMLLMSVVLGQSVLACVDMHIVFEETDTHHQHDNFDDVDFVEEDYSGDDCGHCCHANGCNLSLITQNHGVHFDFTDKLIVQYHETPYFYYSDPAIRPPIA